MNLNIHSFYYNTMPLIHKLVDGLTHDSKFLNSMIKLARGLHYIRQGFRFKERKALKSNNELLFERYERLLSALELKVPDRIPISTACSQAFPAIWAGYTIEEFLYDPKKNEDAFYKFITNFPGDATFPSFYYQIGNLVESVGLKVIKIPGRDLPPTAGYQFVERELMKPEDYDRFGTIFFKERILPEIIELAAEHPGKGISTFKTLNNLLGFLFRALHNFNRTESYGTPMIMSGFGLEPFDVVSFILRGLKGISLDIRKIPDKVKWICDRIAPSILNMGIQSARIFKNSVKIPENIDSKKFDYVKSQKMNIRPGIFFVCERAFMLSPAQFEEVAFPSLNYVVKGLVDAGLIPILTFEQDVTHLLPTIRKLPGPGKVIFNCDLTNIEKAKEILGDRMCIMGNIPNSLLTVGTPLQIEKHCRNLITNIGHDGGFVLGAALAIPDEAKPENVKAMIDAGLKYGKYS